MSGITTLQGIATALAARGIPTARGGDWNAMQVSNVLKRAGSQVEDAPRGRRYRLPAVIRQAFGRAMIR